jgi:hypothetical protein
MAVAAQGDVGRGPVFADLTNDLADPAPHFLTGRRLAWPQDDHDGPTGGHVVDMDRLEAILAFVGVDE